MKTFSLLISYSILFHPELSEAGFAHNSMNATRNVAGIAMRRLRLGVDRSLNFPNERFAWIWRSLSYRMSTMNAQCSQLEGCFRSEGDAAKISRESLKGNFNARRGAHELIISLSPKKAPIKMISRLFDVIHASRKHK